MFKHFSVLSTILSLSLCVYGCGAAPEEPGSVDPAGDGAEFSDENGPDTAGDTAGEGAAAITFCDAVAGDCPSPVVLRSGDVFTVFFDYLVEGEEAKEFSATGTSPQVSLSPVMVGAQGAGDRASIEVTAHALGEGTVDIVIWYGESKDIERTYNLLVSIIE
jgi:hypothetical protein